MKRGFVGVLAVVSASIAGLASASAPVAVTCGDTISATGHYVLAGDCTASFSGGINITANDVTLELQGHTITNVAGPGGPPGPPMPGPRMCFPADGIRAFGVSNVRVKGPGTITGFLTGISLSNVSGARVEDVTLTGGCGIGLGVYQSDGGEFLRNVSTDNQDGIRDGLSTGDRYEANTTNANQAGGIEIAGSTDDKVHGNSAHGNGSFDLSDDTASCGGAHWAGNDFDTANQTCIR